MYCQKCGTKLNDGMRFCPKCGTSVPEIKYENTGVISQNSVIEERKVEQSSVAGSNSIQFKDFSSIYDQDIKMPEAAALPMKWYKFLVYFVLFASALAAIIAVWIAIGLLYLDGKIYNFYIYKIPMFSKILLVVYIIANLLLAGFSIFTRQMLAKFKTNAIRCLYIMYVCNFIINIIYCIALQVDLSTVASVLVISPAMLLFNYLYFKKRKHLFVN